MNFAFMELNGIFHSMIRQRRVRQNTFQPQIGSDVEVQGDTSTLTSRVQRRPRTRARCRGRTVTTEEKLLLNKFLLCSQATTTVNTCAVYAY